MYNSIIQSGKLFSLIFFLTIATTTSVSQDKTTLYKQHKETIDDTPLNVIKKIQDTSPAFTFENDMIFVTQVNVDDKGRNIVNDAANEPSIAFNYTNPNNIVIGWRQFDDVNSNFRQAGYAYTKDGGVTWTFPEPLTPGVFRSDPVLDTDAQGNIYYNSLTLGLNSDFICHVFKSTTGGSTWETPVYAKGGDKQWMVIDKVSDIGKGNIYAYWTAAYSICSPNSFTRSVNGGSSFEQCSYIPNEPFWGTLTVDKNGDLFIGGFDGDDYVVVKSTSAKYADSLVSFKEPVAVNMGGTLAGFGGPNPAGITGQTYIAADTSDGPYSGNIYLLGTVTKTNPKTKETDPADIMVATSKDGGKNWLAPVRVVDDTSTTAYQWFGTLSVAPNGRVDVVWLDTRNAAEETFFSELYYSFSLDGGQTWAPNINLMEENFDPHVGWPQQNKMGDYFDMVSDNEGVHLAWAATFNGEQDVYYGRIYTDKINDIEEKKNQLPTEFTLEQNYPNPFNPTTKIKFTIPNVEAPHRASLQTKLIVYDVLGREMETLLKKSLLPGNYEVNFNAHNLATGVYFYTLQSGDFVQTRKMILMK